MSGYVGVYWTLPVHWAGFRDLPPSVDAAAGASRTVRYQRERVRRHLAEQGGRLLGEIAFMDTRTDRATDAVHDVLRRQVPAWRSARPTLLAVAFEEHRWRPNPFLAAAADELALPLLMLPAAPLTIDGQVFDPARHFAAWRQRDRSAMAQLRLVAMEGLLAALAEIPPGPGRWQCVANRLNDRGTRTIRGGSWTAENVRKLAGRTRLGDGCGTPRAAAC